MTSPAVRWIPMTHHHQGHKVSPINSSLGSSGRMRTLWYSRKTGPISMCSCKAADYDSMSIAKFVFGYLGNVFEPSTSSGGLVCHATAFRDLMHHTTVYPWGVFTMSTASSYTWWHDEAIWAKALIRELCPICQGTSAHEQSAVVGAMHSYAPAQSSRKGCVPTPSTMSRPLAVGFLMSMAGASVSGGNNINMQRRAVSPNINGIQKRGNWVTPSALTMPDDDDPQLLDSLILYDDDFNDDHSVAIHGHLQWSMLIMLILISHPVRLVTYQSMIGYTTYTTLCTVQYF